MNLGTVANFQARLNSGWCTHHPWLHPWLHPPGPSYATLAEVAIVLGLEGGSSTNCRCPGSQVSWWNSNIVHQSVYLSYSYLQGTKSRNISMYIIIVLKLLYSYKFVLILTVAHDFDGVVIYCQRDINLIRCQLWLVGQIPPEPSACLHSHVCYSHCVRSWQWHHNGL